MSDQFPFRREPGFRDPRDKQLYDRILRLVGLGGASFFADASRLLSSDPPFQAPVHLIGHSLRELDGSIRQALSPLKIQSSDPADQENECEKKQGHRRDIEAILRGLEIELEGKVARTWFSVVGLEGDGPSFVGMAHRHGLSAPRPIDPTIRALWDGYRGVLAAVLDRFEARFLPVMRSLDKLLSTENPTGKDADELAQQLPRSLTASQYFFSRLENPRWIPMLRKRGLFRYPPEPVLSEDGKLVTTTLWPESKYFARMATQSPQEVLRCIQEMGDTQNTRVLEDLVDAMLTMLPSTIAPLAGRAALWVTKPHQFLLPRKLAALAEYLLKGAEPEAAFVILRELLMPERKKEAGANTLPPNATEARFESYEYVHILDTHLPTFTEMAGLRTLELLAELLEIAVRHPESELEDGSSLWRPAIDRSDSIHREDIPDQLTTAVLRTALGILEAGSAALADVLERIERHPQRLFRRIALYLLARYPNTALIRERLTRRPLFADYWNWYEYATLLRGYFHELTPEEQGTVLGWIEEGPDRAPLRRPRFDGHVPTKEEIQREVREWQWERLSVIGEGLPEAWKTKLDALVGEFGTSEPVHPREPTVVSWVGPTSPISAEELHGMEVGELVDRLRTWQAPGGMDAPTPEGLGRLLAEEVSSDPGRFAPYAVSFQGLAPTYVRHLLFGLNQALRNTRQFPWEEVLKLCRWVVDQKDPPGERPKWWADSDPDWSWTRAQIGHLIGDGLLKNDLAIPSSHRDLVWQILERLVEMPEPDQDDDRRDTAKQDPITESLNTVRGTALRAVLRYGVWLADQSGPQVNGRAFGGKGFDGLPEVRELLDRHLDPTHDAAPGGRAVYGEFLPSLVFMDEAWVVKNLARIFPYEGPSADELRAAAWESYLIQQNAYGRVFTVLQDEYVKAIERLPHEPLGESGRGERHQERLAEHIMALYLWGKLPLESGLVPRLFEVAPAAVRDRAVTWVGLVLTNEESEVPPIEAVERLRALWDRCLDWAEADPNRRDEIEAFGWWFASGLLGDGWAIHRLHRGLRIVPRTEADHAVLERMAKIAREHPIEVIECLGKIIEGDERGWVVEVWRDKVKEVLRDVRSVRSPDVRTKLRELVNRLAAKNYVDFLEFLPSDGESKTE